MISLSIAQLINACRDYGIEPNRVCLSPKGYQQLCSEGFGAMYVARGMRFAISTIYTDMIRVDRWSRRWGASRLHASQVTRQYNVPSADEWLEEQRRKSKDRGA